MRRVRNGVSGRCVCAHLSARRRGHKDEERCHQRETTDHWSALLLGLRGCPGACTRPSLHPLVLMTSTLVYASAESPPVRLRRAYGRSEARDTGTPFRTATTPRT